MREVAGGIQCAGGGRVVDRRRLWLRLLVLDVVLLGTLTAFVFLESWLVRLNLEAEGLLTETLGTVVGAEGVVFACVLAATVAVGVAGVVYAWSAEKRAWPFVVLGLKFLVYALIIIGARPSPEVRERALSVTPPDLEQLLR